MTCLTQRPSLFDREELVTELRHAALDLKIPANQLLEEAIEEWLKKYGERR